MCTLIRNLSNGQNVACRDTGIATCVGDPFVILQISAQLPTKWWTPDFWTTISNSSSCNMEGKMFPKSFPSHWFLGKRHPKAVEIWHEAQTWRRRFAGHLLNHQQLWINFLRSATFSILMSWICLSWVNFNDAFLFHTLAHRLRFRVAKAAPNSSITRNPCDPFEKNPANPADSIYAHVSSQNWRKVEEIATCWFLKIVDFLQVGRCFFLKTFHL